MQIKRKKQYRLARFARLFVMVTIVLVIAWGWLQVPDVTIYWREPYATLDQGWTQQVDGQAYALEDVHSPVESSAAIVLTRPITDDMINHSLVFYAKHQEILVRIGDEMVYELTVSPVMEFYGSMGRLWVEVAIPESALGQTLTVSISSDFSHFHTVPADFYCVNYKDIQGVQTAYMWLRTSAGLVILLLAAITYGNAYIWRKELLVHYLLALGDFYLFVGLWICAEVNMLSVLFGRTAVSSLLAMIFIRIMPVAFYHLFVSAEPKRAWWMHTAGIIVWANLVLSLVAQFGFGISLVAQLPYHTVAVVVSGIVCILGMVYQFSQEKQLFHERHVYYATIFILLGAIAEAACYIYRAQFGQYSGIAVALGCVIYALVAHVVLVHRETVTVVQKRELDVHYKELQKKPLTQQINAHFLSNALNTISAYCKQDPEKADRAVQLLATYMREYMHLVNQSENVRLEDELSLVQLYLDIQNMRFDNAIALHYHISFDDFYLPPLSLQPLVENAVRHGIRSTTNTGEVHIWSLRFEDVAEVMITDNGTGFKADIQQAYMGVSLRNVQARVLAMGGTFTLQSQVGQGTQVRIQVPLGTEEHEEAYTQ